MSGQSGESAEPLGIPARPGNEVPPTSATPPPIPQIPVDSSASPADGAWLHEPGIPFWKPTFADSMQYLGWRWLLLAPAVAIVALLALIPSRFGWMQFLLVGGWKVLILLIALPISSFAYAARHALQSRREAFCIHCGYGLTGLPDHYRCPECGRPYSFRLIDEYRRDPAWFIQRCKQHRDLPGASRPFVAGLVRKKKKSRDGT